MLSRIIDTIVAAVAELRARRAHWRSGWYSGLATEADAEAYVRVLRAAAPLDPLAHHRPAELASRIRAPLALPAALIPAALPAVPAWVDGWHTGGRVPPEDPPIFAALAVEFEARLRQRERAERAVRMPTQEMRQVFDQLTEDWRCTYCDAGRCGDCPGCSCPCRLPTLAAAGVA